MLREMNALDRARGVGGSWKERQNRRFEIEQGKRPKPKRKQSVVTVNDPNRRSTNGMVKHMNRSKMAGGVRGNKRG